MNLIVLVLLICGCFSLLLSTFKVVAPRVDLQSLGLTLWIAAVIVIRAGA